MFLCCACWTYHYTSLTVSEFQPGHAVVLAIFSYLGIGMNIAPGVSIKIVLVIDEMVCI